MSRTLAWWWWWWRVQVKVWFQNRRTKHKRIQSDDITDDDDAARVSADAEADGSMSICSDEELVNVDRNSSTSPTSSSPRRSPTFHQDLRLTLSTSQTSPVPLDRTDSTDQRTTHYPNHNRHPNSTPNVNPNSAPNVHPSSDDRRHSIALPSIHHNFRSAAAMFAHHGDRVAPFGGATVTMTSSFTGTWPQRLCISDTQDRRSNCT